MKASGGKGENASRDARSMRAAPGLLPLSSSVLPSLPRKFQPHKTSPSQHRQLRGFALNGSFPPPRLPPAPGHFSQSPGEREARPVGPCWVPVAPVETLPPPVLPGRIPDRGGGGGPWLHLSGRSEPGSPDKEPRSRPCKGRFRFTASPVGLGEAANKREKRPILAQGDTRRRGRLRLSRPAALRKADIPRNLHNNFISSRALLAILARWGQSPRKAGRIIPPHKEGGEPREASGETGPPGAPPPPGKDRHAQMQVGLRRAAGAGRESGMASREGWRQARLLVSKPHGALWG